jgi:S-adenosylmethionine-diacylglycerol 3-amino-3-carboxypropyl transferase
VSDATIRYAQVWEDADVLAEALDVGPGDRVLSICSAGDNAIALLADDPASVVAVDLNPAQIACLALRVAAFRTLGHGEILELVGSRDSGRRAALYRRCRPALAADVRRVWDARPDVIAAGVGTGGTFERYFRLFRRRILPLAHSRARNERLLAGAPTLDERRLWYDTHWDTWRWRLLFRVATSRAVLGRARYPTAFSQVEGSAADRLLARVREAVTATDPALNPYLRWILTGTHDDALPRYLRAEHFEAIRSRLDRLSWRLAPLDHALAEADAPFTQFNLSDVFEYLPPDQADALFARVAEAGAPGARLAHWSVLADRRPGSGLDGLVRLDALADRLHAADKAPFYTAFHVHEVR